MSKEEDLKKEAADEKSHLLERHAREFRSLDDMPSQYEGEGPQENSDVGYDALEDL